MYCDPCDVLCLCSLKNLSHAFSVHSDGVDTSAADNFNDIYYSLKYEADLLFTRFVSSSVRNVTGIFVPSSKFSAYLFILTFGLKGTRIRLDTTSNQTCLWRSQVLSAPLSTSPFRYEAAVIFSNRDVRNLKVTSDARFFASQIQNLGYFPVRDLLLNIEIPEMPTNGNRLLLISDFSIDKVSVHPSTSGRSNTATPGRTLSLLCFCIAARRHQLFATAGSGTQQAVF